MNRIIIALITALASSLLTYAAPHPELKFKQIGIAEGLSHATVAGISQDARGYIWVATSDGLDRYDGYGFKVYRHNQSDSTSLADNALRHLRNDADGRLWIAAANTLSLYDPSADRFVNYRLTAPGDPEISDILHLPDGRILLATSAGLFTFSRDGSFARGIDGHPYTRPAVSLALKDKTIFVGDARGGVTAMSTDGTSMRPLRLPGNPFVKTMLPDGGQHLLLGTEGRGLLRYNLRDDSFTEYRAGGPEGLGSDYVRSLAHDREGRVWVGTFHGLAILDHARRRFTLYDPKPETAESLSHTSVRCIYADNQGGMWLGTFFGGLNYHHPLRNQFVTLRSSQSRPSLNDNVVGTMAEDSRGRIWIGTNNGGLNIYDPAEGSYRHFTKADGLGSDDVKAIFLDEPAGKAYVGAHIGGLSVLDIATERITRCPGVADNVYSIIPARRPGHLWLATLDGIQLFDKATGRSERVATNLRRGITDLYRDSAGHLWVYGEDGIEVYDENAASALAPAPGVLPDAFPGGRVWVYNVYQSRDGRSYWISTGQGLWHIDIGSGNVTRYSTDNGLPNDIVYGVLEDPSGSVWCSTNHGLALLDPADGSVRTYSARDGLQSNQFNPKSFLRSSSGRLYFGGVNGLTAFNPSVLESNPYSPAPIISGLRLFNRAVTPGDETGLLTRSISETEKITLGVDQTVFTVDFTVCNYVAGDHNTFAYMLEGLDKDWYTTDGPGSVTYSNLPAGNYRFLLRAANNDGVWCSTVTGLDITILPVWYKRWWAIVLFVLVAVAATAGVLRYFWRKRALEEQLRLERVDRERQRELNEMKVRFFINMSHELRTPLTLILLPVEEMLERASDPKTVRRLNTVKNNANRILHIVNQLLDYRRAELGMFRLKVEPVQINGLIRDIFDNYEYQAQRRGIIYTLDSSVPDRKALCDPQYIELICNNLLSNAFKYTPKGQSITMSLDLAGTREVPALRIRVADTGCGIPAEKISEIFTRFYQVNDRTGGSGIGLSLVKRLVELHHGTISVSSTLGKGTEFTVEIPIGEEAYSTEETTPAGSDDSSAAADAPAQAEMPVAYLDDTADEAPGQDSASDEAEESDDSGRTKPSVLVVDDNPEILKYICGNLADTYNVLPAADGAKAIQVLSQQPVDLILTDIMMPDIDGVQLCRTVKRNLRTSHIPVIMLSAKSDVADQLGGFKVGADDYIPKPFSMPLLAAKIKNLLRTRDQAIRHFNDSAKIEPEKVAMNPLDEEFLRKAVDTMERHLDDSQFSTDAFAREMCMSRSNLHLKMKALTGESTNEFIRRFRLQRALELLKTGRYTVSEVSAMVGYGTPSYFATSFKKFFGTLPSEYVKKD